MTNGGAAPNPPASLPSVLPSFEQVGLATPFFVNWELSVSLPDAPTSPPPGLPAPLQLNLVQQGNAEPGAPPPPGYLTLACGAATYYAFTFGLSKQDPGYALSAECAQIPGALRAKLQASLIASGSTTSESEDMFSFPISAQTTITLLPPTAADEPKTFQVTLTGQARCEIFK